jgi:hypothetical protein
VRFAAWGLWFDGIYQIDWADYATEGGVNEGVFWVDMDYSTDAQRITIDWGDGTSESFDASDPYELYASHVYADSGSYLVTITAEMYTDPTETFQLAAYVDNADPTASGLYSSSMAVDVGQQFSVSLIDPADPSPTDASNLTCSIDWGDGSLSTGGCSDSFTHDYSTPGAFNVTARITDPDGGYSEHWQSIQARPLPPQSLTGTLVSGPAGANQVNLSWSPANSSGVTGYVVHRSTQPSFTPSDGTPLVEVPATQMIYSDYSLNPQTTYHYSVITVAGGIYSAAGPTTSVATGPAVDLDIDSDNNQGFLPPARDAGEDAIEDNPNKDGKIIGVNNDDIDGDGVPGFADGYNVDGQADNSDDATTFNSLSATEQMVPLVLELPPGIDPQQAMVRFRYDDSPPLEVEAGTEPGQFVLPAGYLRLWRDPETPTPPASSPSGARTSNSSPARKQAATSSPRSSRCARTCSASASAAQPPPPSSLKRCASAPRSCASRWRSTPTAKVRAASSRPMPFGFLLSM